MKLILKLLILFPTLLFFISCEREISNQTLISESKNYTDSEIVVIFSTLGKLHNDGLDSIYSVLEKNNLLLNNMPNTIEKRNLIYSLINQSIHKFINGYLQNNEINIDGTLNSLFNDNSEKLFGKDIVTQVTETKKNISFSPTYLILLNKIDSLVNINAKEDSYNNLVLENLNSLDENFEKMQFIASVSIAFNSTNYWKKNLRKWNYLLNHNYVEKTIMTVPANPNKTGNDIGKADVSGIIYGAGIGCGIGAFGGSIILPGIGTVTGCAGVGALGALTGGLGNSAKTAVDKFVDWLTK
jgi:hypothetical protein